MRVRLALNFAGSCKIITGFSGENDSLGKQTQGVYDANVKQLQQAYAQGVNNCIDDAKGKLEGRTQCWDPAAVTRDARQCVVGVRTVLDALLRQSDAAYGWCLRSRTGTGHWRGG